MTDVVIACHQIVYSKYSLRSMFLIFLFACLYSDRQTIIEARQGTSGIERICARRIIRLVEIDHYLIIFGLLGNQIPTAGISGLVICFISKC